tara:strand:- start:68 stop:1231 length:1164 start_codon:yes stop_codon:yes gene_type:complete
MNLEKIIFVIKKFFINSKVLNIEQINLGHINNTYLVEHLYNGNKSKFILQSLSNIFESHEIVNMNHKLITDHINKKTNKNRLEFHNQRWDSPDLIKCQANNLFAFPFESDFWRAMLYIDRTFSSNFLEDRIMAYQTGLGLAKFHMIYSDFDCSKLKTSIKNFHNTKYYIDQYNNTIKNLDLSKLDKNINLRIQNLMYMLSDHIRYIEPLYISLKSKIINFNVIHGDPKLSNFLFDIQSKYVVSLVDLDTVTSGYLLTDIADCIRSACNLSGEDPENIDSVYFDTNSCRYLLKGYFSLNNERDKDNFKFLPEFIYIIIFELTIRFLTDFLQSNKYFKIKYETHNLFRAEVQYQLLSSFLLKLPSLTNELDEIGISSSSTFVSDVQKFV